METWRRNLLLAAAGLTVLVLAGVVSAVTMLIPGGSDSDSSFARVPVDSISGGAYCADDAYFCITRQSAESGFALATVNARSFSVLAHHDGCPAKWRPNFDLSTVNGGPGRGAFRVPCDGHTWEAFRVRLFGPAPGDLTRLPLQRDGDVYVLDLRPLHAIIP